MPVARAGAITRHTVARRNASEVARLPSKGPRSAGLDLCQVNLTKGVRFEPHLARGPANQIAVLG